MTKTVTVQGQQKWECCMVTRKTETPLLAELNALGQDGWEVITVLYYKDLKGAMAWTAFLKRPSTGAAPVVHPTAAATVQPSAPPTAAGAGGAGFDLSDDEFGLAPE